MKNIKRYQNWFCESCDKSGRVAYNKREEVYSVIKRIRAAHTKKCPACPAEVRVKVSECHSVSVEEGKLPLTK